MGLHKLEARGQLIFTLSFRHLTIPFTSTLPSKLACEIQVPTKIQALRYPLGKGIMPKSRTSNRLVTAAVGFVRSYLTP